MDIGPLPASIAIPLIEQALDRGFIAEQGDDFCVPDKTVVWCQGLVDTHEFFSVAFEATGNDMDLDFCLFSLIEAMSGRRGDVDELLSGLIDT